MVAGRVAGRIQPDAEPPGRTADGCLRLRTAGCAGSLRLVPAGLVVRPPLPQPERSVAAGLSSGRLRLGHLPSDQVWGRRSSPCILALGGSPMKEHALRNARVIPLHLPWLALLGRFSSAAWFLCDDAWLLDCPRKGCGESSMVCLQMLPQTQIVGIEPISDSVTMLARQFALTGLHCVGAVRDRRRPRGQAHTR